jgi:hypothetical protein
MNDEEKKEKLMKYLIAVDRLKRKCDDAARWESMSCGPSGEVRAHSHQQNHPDTIKDTAIQLRQECESLAIDVRGLRQELGEALVMMKDDRLKALLESKYIDGMSNRQLQEHNSYSERHMRRLMTQAVRELDRCSSYFS